jgi:tetraacyldisaccharide 4'-kinase
MAERVIERVWRGDGAAATTLRALLSPLGMLYLAISRVRNRLFDMGVLRSSPPAIPAMSIGNLTAGGTGKTPIAAWFAAELRRRGASPAIVMRGYGLDEVLVHAILQPETPVIVAAWRARGVEEAARKHGSDVAVLDDAFQHRWVQREVDVVLLSAEQSLGPRHGLPAGPWRESLESVRRASLAIVTRKSASVQTRDELLSLIESIAPGLATAAVHLVPDAMVSCVDDFDSPTAERRPLREIADRSVFVIAAVGDGRAFVDQIVEIGARVTEELYPDHHSFLTTDMNALAARAGRAELVLCTLKDAVKLAPRWPKDAPPLWYVSQQVIIERGAEVIDAQIDRLLEARLRSQKTAGASRPIP